MHRNVRKNFLFCLIAFFAFGYQFSNISPFESDTVRAAEQCSLILGGQSIGVSINNGGITVVDTTDFQGEDGKKHSPAKECGIEKGDVIVAVNDEKIMSSKEFSDTVNGCDNEKVKIAFIRNGEEKLAVINAVKSADDGKYRLGLWVNDGINGLGTLTFINPKSGDFGALGHGVKDGETGKIANGKGSICFANITDVNKSTSKEIGEVIGYFSSSEIGKVKENTEFGIFGTFKGDLNKLNGKVVETASREEIKKGAAHIVCCVDNEKTEKFSVDIEKIYVNSKNNRNMVIRITDEKLLERTGGIVQGMSGSPIIQNGKLVGAVTHVFVNDPTRGYGIFIENMLLEAEKIK